jgi:glycosyltransferase involved in cell wall biosynthesis
MIERRPTLSVIVPVYNMERYLRQCLSAILRFQELPMEVIAVDDGSTDGTRDVLSSFSDRRLVVLRANHGGVSAARNAAFKHSRGEIILPVDADDVPIVESWRAILMMLAANPDAALVYGASREFRDDAEDFPKKLPWEAYPADNAVIPLIFKRNFVPSGTAFFRRQAIESAGLWNESLTVGEDWDMCCRMACVGRIIYCPVLAIGHRMHSQSATGAPVSAASLDPGIAAVEMIYSHDRVRRKVGSYYHKLKRDAFAWQGYLWGARLIRSGAYWPGAKTLARALYQDPSLLLHLCSYPKRRARRLLDDQGSIERRSRRVLPRSNTPVLENRSDNISAPVGVARSVDARR